MAGQLYKVIPKTFFDFSILGAAATQEIVIARAIPIINYIEATVLFRYHAQSTAALGAAQSIDVRIRAEDPSPDDPSIDFVNSTDLAVATINNSSPAPPALSVATLTPSGSVNSSLGSYLRVLVRGTQGAVGGTTLQAYISVDLVLKSR